MRDAPDAQTDSGFSKIFFDYAKFSFLFHFQEPVCVSSAIKNLRIKESDINHDTTLLLSHANARSGLASKIFIRGNQAWSKRFRETRVLPSARSCHLLWIYMKHNSGAKSSQTSIIP